jgi:LacI family transcriptional regulator
MAKKTVYDVARKAGVSIATISRVLNSPDKVNSDTRARVMAAIDELGFVPSAEAAARARKSTGRIGVLAPLFTFPSFIQRLRGVALELQDSPYELVIYNVDSYARLDGYLASLVLTRRLDGLIVMALPFARDIAERLREHQMETVLVEYRHPQFSSVWIDDHYGGQIAAEFLLSKGHTRVAFIGDAGVPESAIHTSDTRLRGFRDALSAANGVLPEAYVALGPHGFDEGRQLAHGLLQCPEPPTAIFCASDTQAMGALQAARERGLRVPNDMAILGFDDLDVAAYIGLSTIRQHLEESGRLAAELLLARLSDPARPVQHPRLALELVVRETT